MSWRKKMKEKKKQKLLAEAKELIGDRRSVKASFLYNRMNITGAMAASLLRGLGFKKISNRVWSLDDPTRNTFSQMLQRNN